MRHGPRPLSLRRFHCSTSRPIVRAPDLRWAGPFPSETGRWLASGRWAVFRSYSHHASPSPLWRSPLFPNCMRTKAVRHETRNRLPVMSPYHVTLPAMSPCHVTLPAMSSTLLGPTCLRHADVTAERARKAKS